MQENPAITIRGKHRWSYLLFPCWDFRSYNLFWLSAYLNWISQLNHLHKFNKSTRLLPANMKDEKNISESLI